MAMDKERSDRCQSPESSQVEAAAVPRLQVHHRRAETCDNKPMQELSDTDRFS